MSRGPSRTSSSTTRADSGVDPVRLPAPSVRRYGLPAKSESIEIALGKRDDSVQEEFYLTHQQFRILKT